MKKLVDYFSSKRQAPVITVTPSAPSNPALRAKEAVPAEKALEDFPELSEKEEQEIRTVLNIRRRDVDTKSVILQTIKTFKELPIAEDDTTGKPVAVIKPKEAEVEAEDENEDFATFRINLGKRGLKIEDNEDDDCIYDTFRVKKGGGSDDDDEDGVYDTFQPGNSGGDEADFLPVFRVPDDWELKILALEKGEWVDGMENDNAFRRWKKERPKLRSSVFAQPLRKSVSRKSGAMQPLAAKPAESKAKAPPVTNVAAHRTNEAPKPTTVSFKQPTTPPPKKPESPAPSPPQFLQGSSSGIPPRRPSAPEPPTMTPIPVVAAPKKSGSHIVKPTPPSTAVPVSSSPTQSSSPSSSASKGVSFKTTPKVTPTPTSPAVRGKWPPESSSSSAASSPPAASSVPKRSPVTPSANSVAAAAKAKAFAKK